MNLHTIFVLFFLFAVEASLGKDKDRTDSVSLFNEENMDHTEVHRLATRKSRTMVSNEPSNLYEILGFLFFCFAHLTIWVLELGEATMGPVAKFLRDFFR